MEEWRAIPEFEDYEVSNLGNVRRVGKLNNLKQQTHPNQRIIVYLYKNGDKYTKQLHRLIAECFIENPNKYECVDHINRNPLDNRIENLRWCTISQNNHNKVFINKSGFMGVCKHRRKYKSIIHINGKQCNLGHYDTPEEAHAAYVAKKNEIAGEFSPFNTS
jgi:hypothetical protein